MALLGALPGSLIALILLWTGDYTTKVPLTFSVLIVGFWLGFAFALRERVRFPLQTLSNLLAALREGDYSIRARSRSENDALGEVMTEVNALGDTLREQRLTALEATHLLKTVMAEIDVAVLAFDEDHRLRLVNRAGERLMGRPSERLLGCRAVELDLEECLAGEPERTVQRSFPGGAGRWGIRRGGFREVGRPHQVLVISDLSQPLRQEERQAWKRLIRVLGHELNNSLAPIRSMADTLEKLLVRQPRPADWEQDMREGLRVIGGRSGSLSRFLEAYSQLARLPPPNFQALRVEDWVRRVVGLENRLPVDLRPGPELTVQADGDQLEQLLINLLRNSVDAALETGGGVSIGWGRNGSFLEVNLEDEGPGLPDTLNLFVPFFTTKPDGTGIGLVLSRQIAEAHGGTLVLRNREPGPGCQVRLRLPI